MRFYDTKYNLLGHESAKVKKKVIKRFNHSVDATL
jgi:hypothetical protein